MLVNYRHSPRPLMQNSPQAYDTPVTVHALSGGPGANIRGLIDIVQVEFIEGTHVYLILLFLALGLQRQAPYLEADREGSY
jgi:hypothetical protein